VNSSTQGERGWEFGFYYRIKMKNQISKIMQLLESNYLDKNRTTLNSMRQNPDPFKILVSCLISLRTQDKNTAIASNRLFAQATTPQQIIKLPSKKLEKLIYSSGHYKKKSRILKSVSKEILERFNNKVPQSEEELLTIKGVGRKTANIVRRFAYNKSDALPVDVNVHRVVNRLGWVQTKDADKSEEELRNILPKKFWEEFNATMILHGKSICVPISPKCSQCMISQYCPRVGVGKSR